MMKKPVSLLLSLALSIGAIGALTACETEPAHTHSYSNGVCSCGETDPNATPAPAPVSYKVSETEWNNAFNLGANFTLTAQQTDGTRTEKYVEKRAENLYQHMSVDLDAQGNIVGHERNNFYAENNLQEGL